MYILACLGFVFLALIEFAMVLSLSKESRMLTVKKDKTKFGVKKFIEIHPIQSQNKMVPEKELQTKKIEADLDALQKKVDRVALLCFTISFVLFNLGYLFYYKFSSKY